MGELKQLSESQQGLVERVKSLGQQIYLAKWMSLRVDYRLLRYNEKIQEKVIPTKLGQTVGERVNWSNSITLGVTFLIGRDSQ